MPTIDEVIVSRRGSAGLIRLNRPKALNSLSLPMVRAITAALDEFAVDPDIASVVVSGEGDRGFCAGGDIRALHTSGREHTPEALTFLRKEFRLNHIIAQYPKPYVALMDGITMGGGVGISAHGSHRVVTERTRLAMPETGIGYFPDVGATWLLSHATGETGTWLGLTGLAVGPDDALFAGLADHRVSSDAFPGLVEAIAALPSGASADDVGKIMAAVARPYEEGSLAVNAALIDHCFSLETVESILAALAGTPGDFAAETSRAIASRSPTSLRLTLRLLRAGRTSLDLAECLEREFAACHQILKTPDFYEGIRAAVIDKDRNPRWSPASLEDVGESMIDRFFAKVPERLFEAAA